VRTMALRNLLIRVGADLSGLTKGMANANKQLDRFSRKAGATMKGFQGRLAAVGATLGAGMIIQGGVEDAIRYEALMGTLSSSMGDSIKDFQKWQQEVGSAFGYSKLQSADLANTLSLNFKRIATDQADLVAKTTKMMEMAALVANKRGMAMTEVSDRIRSAMNQEADGADELGVNVRVAAIEQSNAYKQMGVSGPWDKLSENMRKTILYHHILEEVSRNLGNTLQDNTQIRLSGFQAKLGDVKMALGQAFLPIIYTVLPLLTAFMTHIERALQYVSAFMRTLFGISGDFGGMETSLTNTESASYGAAGGIEALGDATEKAGKQAKEAAKNAGEGLQGFDEVNLLANKAANASGGGGGGGGIGGGGIGGLPLEPERPPIEKPDLSNIYGMIAEKAKLAGEKVKEFFKNSKGWGSIKEGLSSVWQGLKDIYNTQIVQFLMDAIGIYLPVFFDNLMLIVGGALETIGGSLQLLGGILDGDLVQRFQGWGDIINGVFDMISGAIGLLFPEVGELLQEWNDGFEEAWDKFVEDFVVGNENLMEVVREVFIHLRDKAVEKIEELRARGIQKIEDFKEDFKRRIVKMIFDAIMKFTEFRDNIDENLENIKKMADLAFTVIKNKIKDRMQEAWDNFKAPFVGAYNWFKKNVSDPISKAMENITKAFDVSIGNGFKAVYNTAVKWINGMILDINKIKIPGVWGGVDLDTIPYLAQGGIVTSPTLAVVGEGRSDEVVSPLDKLQGYITNAVLGAMNVGGGGNSGSDVVLNIDGRTFARIVKPLLDREENRVGTDVRIRTI
jgi:hypothetical protein